MLDIVTRGFKNATLKLRGQTRLTEDNLKPALREVRASLIQADVELSVIRDFLDRVKGKALGDIVRVRGLDGRIQDVTPQDHFVKSCYDELVDLMGPEDVGLTIEGSPAVLMMVGLQGSGKTTTTGKLAMRLVEEGRRPLLVAADVYRPAAIEQLKVLGRKLDVPVFSVDGMMPVDLAKNAVAQARETDRDVVIIDTAGRLAIDNALMDELVEVKAAVRPGEILFVCDAMIGQDSVKTAAEFDRRLDFTGFVLTKMDGDARGGAALSIKAVTGKPVKFLGQGEELDRLEAFRADGLAQRILGFGDVVGLMQDFERHVDQDTAEKSAQRMLEGSFSYDDFISQMRSIRRMGPLRSIMAKMPFMSDLLDQLPEEALDDRELDRTLAIVQSMTKQERKQPDVLNDSRMKRIARGCGRDESEVRELHERFLQARQMMKQLGGMMGGGGGMNMANLQKQLAAMGGGGGMPGLPGFPGMGKAPKPPRPRMSADERRARKAKRKAARKSRKG